MPAIPRSHSTRSVIERTLDDAIARLCLVADASIESRGLLVEARRLKGQLVGWRSSPPAADARREMLAQVMKLATVVADLAPTGAVALASDTVQAGGAATAAGPAEPLAAAAAEPMRRATPINLRAPLTSSRSSSSSTLRAVAPGWRVLEVPIASGVVLLRASASDWRPYAILAGASVKLLQRDASTGCYTAVVKMGAGSELPRHRHGSAEEMYLIEGALEIGGVEAQAGDYCRAEPGSVHEVIKTAAGCTFLLSGSERDEILPP